MTFKSNNVPGTASFLFVQPTNNAQLNAENMFSSKKNVFNATLKSGKKPYKHPYD